MTKLHNKITQSCVEHFPRLTLAMSVCLRLCPACHGQVFMHLKARAGYWHFVSCMRVTGQEHNGVSDSAKSFHLQNNVVKFDFKQSEEKKQT